MIANIKKVIKLLLTEPNAPVTPDIAALYWDSEHGFVLGAYYPPRSITIPKRILDGKSILIGILLGVRRRDAARWVRRNRETIIRVALDLQRQRTPVQLINLIHDSPGETPGEFI